MQSLPVFKRSLVALAAVVIFASTTQAAERSSLRELLTELESLEKQFAEFTVGVKEIGARLAAVEDTIGKLTAIMKDNPGVRVREALDSAVAEREVTLRSLADAEGKLTATGKRIAIVRRAIKAMTG